MNDNLGNFEKWFKKPLDLLYADNDAGFVVVIITLPILERYLRQKIKLPETKGPNPAFYREFVNIFPSVGNRTNAEIFWDIYRNGLLHQATLKRKNRQIKVTAGVFEDGPEIECGTNGEQFTVSPRKFSKKVISIVESDFSTYEGIDGPTDLLPEVLPETGISGYRK